jgi:hypothetical protein
LLQDKHREQQQHTAQRESIPKLPSEGLTQSDLRKRFRKEGVEDHEMSPSKEKEKTTYRLTTPKEREKEQVGYEKFLSIPVVIAGAEPEQENLSPPSSAHTIDPPSFSRSQVPFTSREVLSALNERFGKVMTKARDLIGDAAFAPESDKYLIVKRIKEHNKVLDLVENQVRAVRELDLATLDPEYHQVRYQLNTWEKMKCDQSMEEETGKGTELFYFQVITGGGQIIRERHLVPIGFNDEVMPSTNPDVKLYRDKKHFAKIEKFTGEEGQSFMYWWGKYKRRVHLLPDLQNEDKYTAIQEFLGGAAKKIFLGARADKKQSFDEKREYVTGLARLVAQYGQSERRIIELKRMLEQFEIKSKNPDDISNKIAELSSIKGEMLMVMDKNDSVSDLCSMVHRKMKKTLPAMIIGQVETYINTKFAKEEQNGNWGLLVDESLRYANKILHETAYEADYEQYQAMENRMKLVEEKDLGLKTKMMEHLQRSENNQVNKNPEANRKQVRVSCIQASESQIENQEEEQNDHISLTFLNSPEFLTYHAAQTQRYQRNRKTTGKGQSSYVRPPECEKTEPKYVTQGEVAKYIDEIKEQDCFLHAAGKEKHKLWECCMKRQSKNEVLMNMNRCRKCLQPGHVGVGCKVNFMPVCEVCGQTGHLKLFCDLWLKEVAKEFVNKGQEENEKWNKESQAVKKEQKSDPKTTEFQSKTIVSREYKPTCLLVAKESVPNPEDPKELS